MAGRSQLGNGPSAVWFSLRAFLKARTGRPLDSRDSGHIKPRFPSVARSSNPRPLPLLMSSHRKRLARQQILNYNGSFSESLLQKLPRVPYYLSKFSPILLGQIGKEKTSLHWVSTDWCLDLDHNTTQAEMDFVPKIDTKFW